MPAVQTVDRQMTRAVKVVGHTAKDAFWASVAAANGDFDKAGGKGMNLLGDVVDATVGTALSVTADTLAATWQVIPIAKLFEPLLTEEPPALRAGPIHAEYPGTALWFINGVSVAYPDAVAQATLLSEGLH